MTGVQTCALPIYWIQSEEHKGRTYKWAPEIIKVLAEKNHFLVFMKRYEEHHNPNLTKARRDLKPFLDVFHPLKRGQAAKLGFYYDPYRVDLHDDNVMRDPDTGEQIITDPVAGEYYIPAVLNLRRYK